MYNNFEILIQAHNITHWTPSSVKKGYNEFERRRKTLFFNYLDQQTIPNLLIYGTKIAVEDTVTACDNPLLKKSLLTKVGRVNDQSKLLKGLKEGIERYNPSAVAIVRGGDDDGSLLMWDQVDFLEELFKLNLPIYTGIGHAYRITLADKFVDQSFSTPTALGNQMGKYYNFIERKPQDEEQPKKHADADITTVPNPNRKPDKTKYLTLLFAILFFLCAIYLFMIDSSTHREIWDEIKTNTLHIKQ